MAKHTLLAYAGVIYKMQWVSYSKTAASNNWRASPVPAAAVIPASAAYINIAAFKKLVVCHLLKRLFAKGTCRVLYFFQHRAFL